MPCPSDMPPPVDAHGSPSPFGRTRTGADIISAGIIPCPLTSCCASGLHSLSGQVYIHTKLENTSLSVHIIPWVRSAARFRYTPSRSRALRPYGKGQIKSCLCASTTHLFIRPFPHCFSLSWILYHTSWTVFVLLDKILSFYTKNKVEQTCPLRDQFTRPTVTLYTKIIENFLVYISFIEYTICKKIRISNFKLYERGCHHVS